MMASIKFDLPPKVKFGCPGLLRIMFKVCGPEPIPVFTFFCFKTEKKLLKIILQSINKMTRVTNKYKVEAYIKNV